MPLFKKVKNLVQKCDFFSTTEFLRYETEPEYQTCLGGTLSAILLLSLLLTFSNKVIATLSMLSINSSSSSQNADDPVPLTLSTFGDQKRTFMLGVEIWHTDLNQGERYFDIKLMNMNYKFGEATNSSIEYALQPCTLDHWKGYPEIQAKFYSIHMDYWLCLPKDENYQIGGKYSSSSTDTIQISVNKCTNQSIDPRPCADAAVIDQYFANHTQKIYFTIYFINPLINPNDASFLSYYLEDSNYIIFSQTGGEQAQIMMEDYTITTDNSISPFSSYSQVTGGIVQKNAIKNRFEISQDNQNYCTFFIYKSPLSIQITRSYQKLDQILSYIGGLFGTLTICLFIIRIYNNYSFEINLGALLFRHDQNKSNFKKYNFLNFITQLFYMAFKSRLKTSNSWEKVKGFYTCRLQLLKQLDILYLLKRVTFLERAIETMLEDYQLKGMHLLKKYTLEQARIQRRHFKLNQKALQECQQFEFKRKNTNTAENEISSGEEILKRKKNQISNDDSVNITVQDLQISKKENENGQLDQPKISQESEESSQSSNQQNDQQQNTISLLLRLKKQQEKSPLSKRIYDNLDQILKDFIDKYQQEEFQNKKSFSQKVSVDYKQNVKTIDFNPRKRFRVLPQLKNLHIQSLLNAEKNQNLGNILQVGEFQDFQIS